MSARTGERSMINRLPPSEPVRGVPGACRTWGRRRPHRWRRRPGAWGKHIAAPGGPSSMSCHGHSQARPTAPVATNGVVCELSGQPDRAGHTPFPFPPDGPGALSAVLGESSAQRSQPPNIPQQPKAPYPSFLTYPSSSMAPAIAAMPRSSINVTVVMGRLSTAPRQAQRMPRL